VVTSTDERRCSGRTSDAVLDGRATLFWTDERRTEMDDDTGTVHDRAGRCTAAVEGFEEAPNLFSLAGEKRPQ
jgi:hypothetical protein